MRPSGSRSGRDQSLPAGGGQRPLRRRLDGDGDGPAGAAPHGLDGARRPAPRVVLWAFAAASAAILLLPAQSGRVHLVAGLVAVGVVAGVARRRRAAALEEGAAARRDRWWLVGAGLAALVGREAVHALGPDLVLRSAGDVIAIVSYPSVIVGLLRMTGERLRERALDTLLLAAVVPLALGVLAAVLLLDGAPAPGGSVRVSLGIALLCADALAVALTARLTLVTQGRAVPGRHLLVAFSCLLGADVARAAAVVTGLEAEPFGSRVLVVVAYGLVAAAALHDSSPRVDDSPPTVVPMGGARLGLLVGAVLLGPVIMLREHSRHGGWVWFAAAASAAFSLLVVAHLARLVRERTVLEHHALHDDLTGLPNRTLFLDRLSFALARAQRRGTSAAVMFVDLDRFKTVNDSLGHAVGNGLLQATAARLRERVREGDTVARLGGDEFCILLPELAGPAEATAVAAKVLAAFADPFVVEGRNLFASPSIGLAVFPGHGADAEDLLRNADAAMYRAKERGRNTYELYTEELTARARERLTLETQLHSAIEGGQLTLHYQPKVDVRTERIVGVEALVRWQHPQLGLVPPARFIELAEETGLIVPLGEWVLETACGQVRSWDEAGLPPLTIAVNLSARQFRHQTVADMVARVLRRTGLLPQRLELELTESLAMEESELVTSDLGDLHRMGVQCSIDDFGTGYSALSYLTRFPISTLKIDKGFVRRIDGEGDDSAIVRGVIALAHSLKLEVVAEGVETAEQVAFLRTNGCDLMQGYLFSRPLPAGELAALMGAAAPESGAAPVDHRPGVAPLPVGAAVGSAAPALLGDATAPALPHDGAKGSGPGPVDVSRRGHVGAGRPRSSRRAAA
ncbi:MAG: putative bifunctional diguanylate cyclase/phosphodiesterase, partial [Acidimicrobiia bacterium]